MGMVGTQTGSWQIISKRWVLLLKQPTWMSIRKQLWRQWMGNGQLLWRPCKWEEPLWCKQIHQQAAVFLTLQVMGKWLRVESLRVKGLSSTEVFPGWRPLSIYRGQDNNQKCVTWEKWLQYLSNVQTHLQNQVHIFPGTSWIDSNYLSHACLYYPWVLKDPFSFILFWLLTVDIVSWL